MTIIDAHTHVAGDHPDTLEFLERKGLHLLNICVAESNESWCDQEGKPYRQLAHAFPERYSWCTTFDLPTFQPDYIERVIERLDRDFAAGAVACKVWKNVGMEVRNPKGDLVLVDDPLFEPIFAHLADIQKPLLMHIAEPLACWLPLTHESPHRAYYLANPEWHMHGRSDMPSHATLIASRDAVLAKHPTLRVVGAHLGSLEHDVDAVAERLERYPNFAVDVSARLGDLMSQDGERVRAFFDTFADRILFGTDIVMRTPHAELPANERARQVATLEEAYSDHFRYFETDEELSHGGVTSRGIHLDDHTLEKFYTSNARTWYQLGA